MAKTKICNECKTELPATLMYFYKDDRLKCGLKGRCRFCIARTAKTYRQNNPELVERIKRDHHYRSKFNITLEQYDKMFEEQNGNCAICGLPELMRRLAVDHNHETGEVRALLCVRCNNLLGYYEKMETEKLRKKFKNYLIKFNHIQTIKGK